MEANVEANKGWPSHFLFLMDRNRIAVAVVTAAKQESVSSLVSDGQGQQKKQNQK